MARLDQRVGDHHLDLDLGQEVDHVFGAAIELGVALLAPETLDLGHRHAGDADFRQRLAHLVELERLDDRLIFFMTLPKVEPLLVAGPISRSFEFRSLFAEAMVIG